jgi:hypothetical protein
MNIPCSNKYPRLLSEASQFLASGYKKPDAGTPASRWARAELEIIIPALKYDAK